MAAAVVHKAPYFLPVLAACLGQGKTLFSFIFFQNQVRLCKVFSSDCGTATQLEKVGKVGKLQHCTPVVCGYCTAFESASRISWFQLIFCHRVNYLLY